MRWIRAILSRRDRRLPPRRQSLTDVESSVLNIEMEEMRRVVSRDGKGANPISSPRRDPCSRSIPPLACSVGVRTLSTSDRNGWVAVGVGVGVGRRQGRLPSRVADTKWHLPDKGYTWTSHNGGRRDAAWTRCALPFYPTRAVPRAQPTKPPPWVPVSRASRVGGGQRDTLGCHIGLACVVRDRGVVLSGSDHFSTTRSHGSLTAIPLSHPLPIHVTKRGREGGRDRTKRRADDDDDDNEVQLSRGGCDHVASRRSRVGGIAPLSDAALRQQTHARQTREPVSREPRGWWRNNPLM